MCRWFTLLVLQYLVCIISVQGQEERDSLIRSIHPRRHKRAEQVRQPVISRTHFAQWKNDPKCMIEGRDMMSCPKKNAEDPNERLVCIEPYQLCDDHQDCLGADDEEPHFCMFKKLEDAEMRRIKAEIFLFVQNSRKQQPQFKDVVVNNDDTSDAPTTTDIKQPDRPGIFKINGLGPLGKSKMFKNAQATDDDVNKSIEETEEEEDNEEENEDEDEEEEAPPVEDRATKMRELAAARAHARRRTLRHVYAIKAIRL